MRTASWSVPLRFGTGCRFSYVAPTTKACFSSPTVNVKRLSVSVVVRRAVEKYWCHKEGRRCCKFLKESDGEFEGEPVVFGIN